MVLRMAYTAALHQPGRKDQVDAAILRKEDCRGDKMCLGDLVMDVSFDSNNRMSSVIVESKDYGTVLICKGVFEEIVGLCTHIQLSGEKPSSMRESLRPKFKIKQAVPLGDLTRESLANRVNTLHDDGYHVLGVATRILPSDTSVEGDTDADDLCHDLVFQGTLTFLESPRDDAAPAIGSLQALGVNIKFVACDNVRVSLKLCRDLNILSVQGDPTAITGPELEQMSKEDFVLAVRPATVLADLTTGQKRNAIHTLQQSNQCISMLASNSDDRLDLSAANIGIALKFAVIAVQHRASVVPTSNNLRVIPHSIRATRCTHVNETKYIKITASANIATALSVLIAPAWLPYQTMTATQLLVQRALYSVVAMVIPFDRVDATAISRRAGLSLQRTLWFIALFASVEAVLDVSTFLVNFFVFDVRDALSPDGSVAQTHWFLQSLFLQILLIHVLRTDEIPWFRSLCSGVLGVVSSAVAGVGTAMVYVPTNAGVFGMGRVRGAFVGCLEVQVVVGVVLGMGVKILAKRWI